MSRSVEAVITRLKGMIDRNGPHHLSDRQENSRCNPVVSCKRHDG